MHLSLLHLNASCFKANVTGGDWVGVNKCRLVIILRVQAVSVVSSFSSLSLFCIVFFRDPARYVIIIIHRWSQTKSVQRSNKIGYVRTRNVTSISFRWYSPKVPKYAFKWFLFFLPIFHRAFICVFFFRDPARYATFVTPMTTWNHFLQEPKMLWQCLFADILQKHPKICYRVIYSDSCLLSRPFFTEIVCVCFFFRDPER